MQFAKTDLPYQQQKDQTLNHGSNQNIARQKFYLSIYIVIGNDIQELVEELSLNL